MYVQGPQAPNLDYNRLSNGNNQFAQNLMVVAAEIVSYFNSGQPNILKNHGLNILQQNGYNNNQFEQLLRLVIETIPRVNNDVKSAVAEVSTYWLAMLASQNQNIMMQLDPATANKVRNVLQGTQQPQYSQPQFQPQINNQQAMYTPQIPQGGFGSVNGSFGTPNNMTTMSSPSSVSANAAVANRYNMGAEQQNIKMPQGMFDRFSTPPTQEVNDMNRSNHQLNPVPVNPVTRPVVNKFTPSVSGDPSFKVDIIKSLKPSVKDLLNVSDTVLDVIEEYSYSFSDKKYAMVGIYTEALTDTRIVTKQVAYDNVLEYLENIIRGESIKHIRYPANYVSFVKAKSDELTRITNRAVLDAFRIENSIDNFIDDFNPLITELQKLSGGADFCEALVDRLSKYLVTAAIHIVPGDTDESEETEPAENKIYVDIVSRKISLLILNVSSTEFEDIYSKSSVGLPTWLDNVPDWFELHIITTDNVIYINECKSVGTLEKVGRLL